MKNVRIIPHSGQPNVRENIMAKDKNYDEAHALLSAEHSRAFPTEAGRNYPRQGTYYIRAATKKAAAERLKEFGCPWAKPADLRVGMGNTLDALDEAGLMETGDLFIVADYGQIVRVSMVDGKPVAKYFGKTATKTVIVPVEEKK
jgi:hypothetical protein